MAREYKGRSKGATKRQLMAGRADIGRRKKDMTNKAMNPAMARIMARKPIPPIAALDNELVPSPPVQEATLNDVIAEAMLTPVPLQVESTVNASTDLLNRVKEVLAQEPALSELPVPAPRSGTRPQKVKEVAKKVKKAVPPPKPAIKVAVPKRDVRSVTKQYISPKPASLLDRLRAKRPLGTSIFKGDDGLRYMMMVTTNSYDDREDEAITTKALGRYVEKSWVADDQCITRNGLRFWHSADDIGEIVWCDMEGPFLLEVAKELADDTVNIAKKGETPRYCSVKAMWDFIEENPDDIDWGSSHGYDFYKTKSYTENRVYDNIMKFESSVLPIKWASNPYTLSGVIDMKPRDKILDRITGIPGSSDKVKSLRQGTNALSKLLSSRGVQHKERKTTKVPLGRAEKAIMEDLQQAISGFLSVVTDNAVEAGKLAPKVMTSIAECLASAGYGTPANGGMTSDYRANGYGYDEGMPAQQVIPGEELGDALPEEDQPEGDTPEEMPDDGEDIPEDDTTDGEGDTSADDGEDAPEDDNAEEEPPMSKKRVPVDEEDPEDKVQEGRKSFDILDQLVEAQEYLAEQMEEISQALKSLSQAEEEPDEDEEDDTEDQLLARLGRIEKQIGLRPKSASQADETVLDDGDLLSRVKEHMSNYDDFWHTKVS